MTRSAPARSSFFSESSADARAMIRMSERSSRALSVMKMFSASESTHAITARARAIPASIRTSSSEAWPSMYAAPSSCAQLAVERVGVDHDVRRAGAPQVARDLPADAAVAADDVVV